MRTLKFILPLLVVLFSATLRADSYFGFAVNNAGDTAYYHFEIPVNMFHGTPKPINTQKRVRVKDAAGNASKLYPEDYQSFTVFDTKVGHMTFESVKYRKKQLFLHLAHRGKLTFYTYYSRNIKDNSLVPIQCLQLPDGNLLTLSKWTWRTKLSKLFYLDEFFARELREKNHTYFDIVAFAKAYDAYEPDRTKR